MSQFSLTQRALFVLAGTVGRWLIACYFVTVRIRNTAAARAGVEAGRRRGGVYAFWHSHQLSAVWHLRGTGGHVLISASKDGEYIARVALALGFRPARGSSSRRGAAGLLHLVRLVQAGGAAAITPDGPRGPRYCIHRGVLELARLSGRPIVPFAIGLSSFWELPSWDRFRVPKPFSRGVCALGEPLTVPRDADDGELDRLGEALRTRMLALERQADELAAREKVEG